MHVTCGRAGGEVGLPEADAPNFRERTETYRDGQSSEERRQSDPPRADEIERAKPISAVHQ